MMLMAVYQAGRANQFVVLLAIHIQDFGGVLLAGGLVVATTLLALGAQLAVHNLNLSL